MPRWTVAVVLAAIAGLVSALPGRTGEPGTSEGWGTIKGRVTWGGSGAPPERKALAVNKDQEHCLANGPLLSEEWVVNKENLGVRWAFVWLAAEPGRKLAIHPALQAVPGKPAVLDQPHCQFVPHALALRQGQELLARNSSAITHNLNWAGGLKNPGDNQIMPPNSTLPIKGLKADRFPIAIKCNIHPWMSAWVRVFDHPYFAVTDADGRFEIKDAPAGRQRLIVWQESVGWRGGPAGRAGTPITVEPGKVTDLGKLDIAP